MAEKRAEIRWKVTPTQGISRPLEQRTKKLPMLVHQIGQNGARLWESNAKRIRPWRDRTTAARAGLTGLAVMEGLNTTIICFHQVDYGPELELGTSRSKPYASILPAFNLTVPVMMKKLEYGVTRLLEGGGNVGTG